MKGFVMSEYGARRMRRIKNPTKAFATRTRSLDDSIDAAFEYLEEAKSKLCVYNTYARYLRADFSHVETMHCRANGTIEVRPVFNAVVELTDKLKELSETMRRTAQEAQGVLGSLRTIYDQSYVTPPSFAHWMEHKDMKGDPEPKGGAA